MFYHGSMPRSVDGDHRRQLLSAAAASLIATAGIGAVTIRNVAAEAGWTTGGLTYYFPDKRALLRGTLEASLEGRSRRRRSRDTSSPLAALRASLADALILDDESRRHWMVTVAFCAEAAGDDGLARLQRDAYRSHRSYITALVERCGLGPADEAGPMAERLIALTDGIALQTLFDPLSWPPARQVETLDRALGSFEVPASPP